MSQVKSSQKRNGDFENSSERNQNVLNLKKRLRYAAGIKSRGELPEDKENSRLYVEKLEKKAKNITEKQLMDHATEKGEEWNFFQVSWERCSSPYEVKLLKEMVKRLNENNATVLPLTLRARENVWMNEYSKYCATSVLMMYA